MALRTDYTDNTVSAIAHAAAHNDANAEVNTHETRLGAVESKNTAQDSQIGANTSAINANTSAINANTNAIASLNTAVARAFNYTEDPTTFGFPTMARTDPNSASALGNLTLFLSYITASATVTVSKMRALTGTQAAVGVTLARMGIYQEAADGTLTLVASTPNDTTLFVTADTAYTKALSAPFQMVAAQRYAFALMVGATTLPSMPTSVNLIAFRSEFQVAPKRAGSWSGVAITDLPATVPPANIGVSQRVIYQVAVP